MHYWCIILVFASLFLLGCTSDTEQNDGGDLGEYLDSIRASGMSERAGPDLRTVGSILSGYSSLSFQRSSEMGRCWPRFTSNSCPDPAMTDEEKKKFYEESQLRYEELVQVLKPIADLDGSGFVSTEEAKEFRGIFEFGCLAFHVGESEGREVGLLESASGFSSEVLPEKALRYNELCAKLLEANPNFELNSLDLSWIHPN